MRDKSDCACLIRAYVRAWPRFIGGETDGRALGFKFHTQSQRNGDLGRTHGYQTVRAIPDHGGCHTFQLASGLVYQRACFQVEAWDRGVPLAEVTASHATDPEHDQTSLPLA